MRSALLYYRKHHGNFAFCAYLMERWWHQARRWRNSLASSPERQDKAAESQMVSDLMKQAWKETNGGRISPPRPW
jgi:hypothetical protein